VRGEEMPAVLQCHQYESYLRLLLARRNPGPGISNLKTKFKKCKSFWEKLHDLITKY